MAPARKIPVATFNVTEYNPAAADSQAAAQGLCWYGYDRGVTLNHSDTLHLATSADHGYALPVAVMVRSALDHLSPRTRCVLHVVDNGLTAEDRRRLMDSWKDARLEVHWSQPRTGSLQGLPVGSYFTETTYCRLLLPELLPDVERVVYLDADILVLQDLTQLRDALNKGGLFAAAVELCVPTIGAPWTRHRPPGPVRSNHWSLPGNPRPSPDVIPNHRALGMSPGAPYYNAGVFVTDLNGWRAEGLTAKLLSCLREHQTHVRYCDQYAINVGLYGRIQTLDPRWNRASILEHVVDPAETGLPPAAWENALHDPWVVHFTGQEKPWVGGYTLSYQQEYWKWLDRTSWAGYRPPRVPWLIRNRVKLQRFFRKSWARITALR